MNDDVAELQDFADALAAPIESTEARWFRYLATAWREFSGTEEDTDE